MLPVGDICQFYNELIKRNQYQILLFTIAKKKHISQITTCVIGNIFFSVIVLKNRPCRVTQIYIAWQCTPTKLKVNVQRVIFILHFYVNFVEFFEKKHTLESTRFFSFRGKNLGKLDKNLVPCKDPGISRKKIFHNTREIWKCLRNSRYFFLFMKRSP